MVLSSAIYVSVSVCGFVITYHKQGLHYLTQISSISRQFKKIPLAGDSTIIDVVNLTEPRVMLKNRKRKFTEICCTLAKFHFFP